MEGWIHHLRGAGLCSGCLRSLALGLSGALGVPFSLCRIQLDVWGAGSVEACSSLRDLLTHKGGGYRRTLYIVLNCMEEEEDKNKGMGESEI